MCVCGCVYVCVVCVCMCSSRHMMTGLAPPALSMIVSGHSLDICKGFLWALPYCLLYLAVRFKPIKTYCRCLGCAPGTVIGNKRVCLMHPAMMGNNFPYRLLSVLVSDLARLFFLFFVKKFCVCVGCVCVCVQQPAHDDGLSPARLIYDSIGALP